MADTRRIGIFGAGWVGLVTGGCFAELGHDVVVRDIVPEKIEALRGGDVPFHETDVPVGNRKKPATPSPSTGPTPATIGHMLPPPLPRTSTIHPARFAASRWRI